MRIGFVVQRYGAEILGGSEYHCRLIAERVALRHEVEVLTTCARDYITWKNEYPEGSDRIRGVTVRRFANAHARNIEAFNRYSDWIFSNEHSREDEMRWLEMQGPWCPALLDYLKIQQADLLGYSMGGGVALQAAIRHPEKVRKVVSISAVFRHDGLVKEAVEAFPQIEPGMFKGSPIETEYKKLSPTPDKFDTFVKRLIQMAIKPYDFGADKLKATKAPMLFIHGDADGVRLDHIAEMFRLKGGEIHGDLRPRSESRLAILPNTTHITLMDRTAVIVPMVNDFLDTQPQKN